MVGQSRRYCRRFTLERFMNAAKVVVCDGGRHGILELNRVPLFPLERVNTNGQVGFLAMMAPSIAGSPTYS